MNIGLIARVDDVVGGPARRKVIAVLAAALALDSADKATIGATATQLQSALHISKTEIGVLLAVTSVIGTAATVPLGVLVDRVNRTDLLAYAVLAWGVATVLSATATSFVFLLCAQAGLGAVTAVAAPAVASLIGDYFPQAERAKVYGYVLSGELVGAGFGFVVAGLLATVSWRVSFGSLAVPAVAVWWLVRRLAEPKRKQRTRHADQIPLWRAAVYVLRVRTNVVLVVASALGYLFFSGVRGFGVEFVKHNYGVSQSTTSLLTIVVGFGALVGVVVGGRSADGLRRRGYLPARVVVAGATTAAAVLLFVPALVTSTGFVAVPLLTVAAAFLGATNAPLDAARLDVMPPSLWGRAEAVRSVLRNGAEAGAPLAFGLLADHELGLRDTFLVMLAPLGLAALLVLLIARRTYPSDTRFDHELEEISDYEVSARSRPSTAGVR